MKRIIAVLLSVALALCLAACNNSDEEVRRLQEQIEQLTQNQNEPDNEENTNDESVVEYSNNSENDDEPQSNVVAELPPSDTGGQGSPAQRPKGTFDVDYIAENLVVHQYSYLGWRDRPWVFHIIENTSEHTLQIQGNLRTFDSAGNILGSKSDSERAVGAGQKTILTYLLDEGFDSSEYEITVSQETWNTPVTQNLSFESTSALNKEIITITNNGDIPARFVEANVLFFNNNVLVNHGSRYFTDNDSEIKPGRSITEEISCRDDYDSIVIVLTGHG
jgi:hypothetical protein